MHSPCTSTGPQLKHVGAQVVTHHSDEGDPCMERGGDAGHKSSVLDISALRGPRSLRGDCGVREVAPRPRGPVGRSAGRGKTQKPMTRLVGKQEGARVRGPFEGPRSWGSTCPLDVAAWSIMVSLKRLVLNMPSVPSWRVIGVGRGRRSVPGHSSVFRDLAPALVCRAGLCHCVQAPQVGLSLASSLPRRLL